MTIQLFEIDNQLLQQYFPSCFTNLYFVMKDSNIENRRNNWLNITTWKIRRTCQQSMRVLSLWNYFQQITKQGR